MQFQPGNQRIYMETNKGTDLTSLVLFDPQTMKTEMVESDPLGKVDFGGALFSEATDELVETWYTADRVKEYYKDKKFGDDVHFIEGRFPGHEVKVFSRTKDDQVWLVTIVSDTEPGETLLFERKTRKLTPQFKIREKLSRADLAEMKSVTYKSSDGLEIPAYLTLPKGVQAKNLPTLVVPLAAGWQTETDWPRPAEPQQTFGVSAPPRLLPASRPAPLCSPPARWRRRCARTSSW